MVSEGPILRGTREGSWMSSRHNQHQVERWNRKKVKVLVSQSCLTLQLQPARLLCP